MKSADCVQKSNRSYNEIHVKWNWWVNIIGRNIQILVKSMDIRTVFLMWRGELRHYTRKKVRWREFVIYELEPFAPTLLAARAYSLWRHQIEAVRVSFSCQSMLHIMEYTTIFSVPVENHWQTRCLYRVSQYVNCWLKVFPLQRKCGNIMWN